MTIFIYISTGDWLGTFEGHKGAIWAVDISFSGHRVATGAADFTSKFWDAETGGCLASSTHSHIVSCKETICLKFWDAETGGCLASSTHSQSCKETICLKVECIELVVYQLPMCHRLYLY